MHDPNGSERFEAACRLLDEAHRADPRTAAWAGEAAPRATIYHQRMAHWLDQLVPDASEALRIAVRAQHINRWRLPRGDFAEGRAGYKKWRSTLAMRHADDTAALLAQAGYPAEMGERVGAILRKLKLKRDPDVQALEDCACLVFLELDLGDFMGKHDDAKVIDILQKTWAKMSDAGHAAAVGLLPSLGEAAREVVQRALA